MKRFFFFSVAVFAIAFCSTSCTDDTAVNKDAMTSEIIAELLASPEIQDAQVNWGNWYNEVTAGRFFGGQPVGADQVEMQVDGGFSVASLYRKNNYPNAEAIEQAYLKYENSLPAAYAAQQHLTNGLSPTALLKVESALNADLATEILTVGEIVEIISRFDPAFDQVKIRTCLDQFNIDWQGCETEWNPDGIPILDQYIACQDRAISDYDSCSGGSHSPGGQISSGVSMTGF